MVFIITLQDQVCKILYLYCISISTYIPIYFLKYVRFIKTTFCQDFSNLKPETLAETIESDPLCIADLFQKFFIYDQFLIKFLIFFLALYYVTL